MQELISLVGGSSEQREVFSEFYIELLFAVGDIHEILKMLEAKIRARPLPHLHMLRTQAYSLMHAQAIHALVEANTVFGTHMDVAALTAVPAAALANTLKNIRSNL